ncbi:hypothetical protein CBL_02305 [Carabus blaptoides fortunei]
MDSHISPSAWIITNKMDALKLAFRCFVRRWRRCIIKETREGCQKFMRIIHEAEFYRGFRRKKAHERSMSLSQALDPEKLRSDYNREKKHVILISRQHTLAIATKVTIILLCPLHYTERRDYHFGQHRRSSYQQIKLLKTELNFSINVMRNQRLKSRTDKMQITALPAIARLPFNPCLGFPRPPTMSTHLQERQLSNYKEI